MPLPGASNINFGAARRGAFNVSNAPGGQLVKYNSPANPNYVQLFAEPPAQLNLKPQLQLKPTVQPLPNLASLPKYTPVKPTINTGSSGNALAATGAKTGIAVSAGGVVGGLTVSNLGLLAALIWASNLAQLYKLWGLSQPEAIVEEALVGQSDDFYDIEIGFGNSSQISFDPNFKSLRYRLKGPLGEFSSVPGGGIKIGDYRFTSASSVEQARPFLISVRRLDGQPEPQLQTQLQRQPAPQPTLEREPLPRFAEPELELKTSKPQLKLIPNLKPLPEKQPIRLQVPSDRRITINFPGQAPIQIQQPQLQTTNPEPTTLTIPRNAPVGQPQPIQVQQPGMQPVTLTSPSTDPFTINIPGYEPIQVDPRNSSRPGGVVGNPLQPRMFTPTPLVATPPLTPSPLTPSPLVPSPQPSPQPTESSDVLIPATILATLTPMLQQLLRNTSPAAMQPLMAGAVCQTTQPGGCMTNLANNTSNNLFDRLKNLIDAADKVLALDTNARVRAVQEDTQKIRQSTGADDFPMILPEYLLDDFIDKPTTVPNQVAYNVWLLKQVDALVGLFPIKIERVDENGQKQMLVFENIAEAIAELTGLIAQVAFDADTAVNVSTRATGEAVGAKAAALQAGSYLKAIIDYMGFQGEPVSFDVPISVTPGAVGLDGKLQESELKDFLKPSTQKAIGFKNTDPVDQRLVLQRILQSGEISRAALFRPLKPDASKNPLTGDAIKADKAAEKKRIDDLWDAFKLRMEGHTAGTKVDIDDGTKPPDGATP